MTITVYDKTDRDASPLLTGSAENHSYSPIQQHSQKKKGGKDADIKCKKEA